jgi:hypothetical protein
MFAMRSISLQQLSAVSDLLLMPIVFAPFSTFWISASGL